MEEIRKQSKAYRQQLAAAVWAYPNGALKEAGARHLKAWDQFEEASEKLLSFGPMKMFFYLPSFLYWNGVYGRARTRVMETQMAFEMAAAACGLASQEKYNLKTFEREGKEPISSIGVPTP